jgi:hypothetical protein
MKTRPKGDGRKDGRTDRHDEANSRFSQFCERVENLLSLHSLLQGSFIGM